MSPARPSLAIALALVASLPLALQAGKVATSAPSDPPKGPSHVQVVDVSDNAADVDTLVKPGHTTIVDVFSQACPPCRALSPKLDELSQKKPGIEVLKLDIGTKKVEEGRMINWGSPFIARYGIHSIPHLMVYDEKGKQVAAGDDAYGIVLGWLREAHLVPSRR